MSCAQTAIIPTNSVIDASAAASSTKIRNIALSLGHQNIEGTLFLFCSRVKARREAATSKPVRLVNSARQAANCAAAERRGVDDTPQSSDAKKAPAARGRGFLDPPLDLSRA
jgi:hypothetical protein